MTVFLFSLCSILLVFCAPHKKLRNNHPYLREVNEKSLIPEGIAVHPSTGLVFLSSLHQNKIVSVSADGVIKNIISSGQNGFMWGLGMKFSNDGKILWACSANGKGDAALFAIDHISGRIIKSFHHDSAAFFNDLVILNDGRIFITDTEKSAVFILENDSIRLFVEDEKLKWANGIAATPAGDFLLVASGRYGVMKIHTSTRAISSVTNDTRTDYAIDGMVLHEHTLYAAIGWPQDSVKEHRIIRYYFDEQFSYTGVDTMSINQPWLQCPTTLAVHKNQLFILSTTNLGIYNRHGQQTQKIMDSLRFPVVAIFQLAGN